MLRFVLAVVLLAGLVCEANALDAEEIVRQHIDAVGGTQAVAAIQTIHRTGVVNGEGMFGQYEGTAEEWLDLASSRIYAVTRVATYMRENGWDGTKGWGNDTQAGQTEWSRDEAAVAQILASPSPLFMLSQQIGFTSLQLGGDTDFHGKSCKLVTVPNNTMQFFVDPQSHLLAGIRIPKALDVIYSDYQTVEGIQLAMTRELVLKDPKTTIVYRFRSARLNVDVNDDLFRQSGNRKKSLPHPIESQPASFSGKQMIQFLDRDGDQRISIEEATDELRANFQFADRNGDGSIDLMEANAIAAYAAKGDNTTATPSQQSGGESSANRTVEGIMALLDEDRDGSIVWAEAPEDLRLFFDEYDENGDGKISRGEAQTIADYLARAPGASSLPKRELTRGKVTAEQLIKQMDKNGDGYIEMDEAPNELKAGFSTVDLNRDEVIDLKEARAIADYLNGQQGD